MYDNFGFIVNQNRVTGNTESIGDSCFFMGWQAFLFCLVGKFREAHKLYAKCAKIDFYRHPLLMKDRNGTSFDMMIMWDLVILLFPDVKSPQGRVWQRPPKHKRQSKFWDGRLANRDLLYLPVVVNAQLDFMRWRKSLGDDYYKNNLIMVRGMISYLMHRKESTLRKIRRLTKVLEGKTNLPDGTTIGNPFFNWLCFGKGNLGDVKLYKAWWGVGSCELSFQRDPTWRDEYRKRYVNIDFHREVISGKRLTFCQQFIRSEK